MSSLTTLLTPLQTLLMKSLRLRHFNPLKQTTRLSLMKIHLMPTTMPTMPTTMVPVTMPTTMPTPTMMSTTIPSPNLVTLDWIIMSLMLLLLILFNSKRAYHLYTRVVLSIVQQAGTNPSKGSIWQTSLLFNHTTSYTGLCSNLTEPSSSCA